MPPNNYCDYRVSESWSLTGGWSPNFLICVRTKKFQNSRVFACGSMFDLLYNLALLAVTTDAMHNSMLSSLSVFFLLYTSVDCACAEFECFLFSNIRPFTV